MYKSKNVKFFFLTAALLFLFHISAFAEDRVPRDSLAYISGKVSDGTNLVGRLTAFAPNILLVTLDQDKPDSLYTSSDNTGIFFFKKIKPQRVYIKIFCVGRKTIEGIYEIEAGQNAFFFEMEEAPEELKESVVTADATLMKQIADTTIYNAAAIRTHEGENLRSMLEQLPGFSVSDNRITVNGESVKRTYVNGVLVFGDNPVTAIDALKADEVAQVRVYDEQSTTDKRRGIKNSKKERVLDVVTKEPILKLTEAGVLGEAGADETGQVRYNGVAGAAYHSEMLQLNGYVYTGNLETFLGKERDIAEVAITSISNLLDVGSSGSDLSSYVENMGANIAMSKYWKDRRYGNNISAKYTYWRHYQKDASTVMREYFASAYNPATIIADTSSFKSVKTMHSANIVFSLKDTPIKSVSGAAYVKWSNSATSSALAESSKTEHTENYRNENKAQDIEDYQVRLMLGWINNDARKIRPSVNTDFTFEHRSSLSWTVDTLETSFDRRQLTSDGFGNSVQSSINFNAGTMLINNDSRTLTLDTQLKSVYNRRRSKTLTVDEYSGYEVDLSNTYDNTWNGLDNSLQTSIIFNTAKLCFTGSLIIKNTLQFDNERYPSPPYSSDDNTWTLFSNDKSYWSVNPSLELRLKSLTISASTATAVPSLEQVRNRITDSNPMMLTGGNPNLKSSYGTNVQVRWQKMMAKGYGSVLASVIGNYNFRPIVSKTEYFTENTVLTGWDGYEALAGSRLITFENAIRPSWSTGININATGLFLKRKINASIALGTSMSSYPQFVGQEMTGIDDLGASVALSLKVRPSKNWYINTNWASNYINSADASGNLISKRIVHSLSFSPGAVIAKKGNVRVNYRMSWYDNLRGVGSDYISHSLNAEIGWSFLKRTLSVSLKGIDLLHSGSTYSHAVTADVSTQTWTPVYGRYFLLSVRYLFRAKN